jgi:predicted GIY-YIG superfamily endonuclease
MVEQSAVNRSVVGSSPTFGAIFIFVLHMYSVYILQNPQGRFYIGQTQDVVFRLIDHNRTDAYEGKYTRKNGPWELVWQENHSTRPSAMQREK